MKPHTLAMHCLRAASLVALMACVLAGCNYSREAPATPRQRPPVTTASTPPDAAPADVEESIAIEDALPAMEAVDELLINGDPIALEDILRDVREQLGDVARPAPERIQRVVMATLLNHVRDLLLYQEAMREMDFDAASAGLERAVDQEIKDRVGREFGGRQTIFEEHLRAEGLTIKDIRHEVRQDVVVRKFLYESILPRIAAPTRQQLWDYYQSNLDDYRHEASRELYLIQVSKGRDASEARARADAALQRIRDGEAFGVVALEVSDGINKSKGGAWGAITSDLRGPYAPVSTALKTLQQDQCSEVVEGPTAWFIVKAGIVQDSRTTSFTEVQDDLRQRFRMEQLNAHQMRLLTMLQNRAIVEPHERLFAGAVLLRLQREYDAR